MSDVAEEGAAGGVPASKIPSWAVCCVCCQVPTGETVRTLPCLHLVCSGGCMNEIRLKRLPGIRHSNVICKTCKVKHLEKEIKPSAYIQECHERERRAEIKKNFVKPTCSYCIRGDNAASWCQECEEYMCLSCQDHHAFATKTRDHVTEAVEQKSVTQDASFTNCSLHQEPLTKYCTSCGTMLCDVCCVKRHTGHATEPLKDLADETKSNIQRNINKLESILPKYEQMEYILAGKAQQMMKTQYDYLATEASAQLARLLSALMKREMEQRQEMIDICLNKSKELNAKKAKVKMLIAQTHHFLKVCKDLMKDGSDWAIISNRQLFETQLFRLLSTADHFAQEGSLDEYTERGFNFVMDKSVGHQAERHINLTAKLNYSYNPKAPPEIKISGPGMQNRNVRSGVFPVNGSKNVANANSPNKPKLISQKPTGNLGLRSYTKTPTKTALNQVPVSPEIAGSSGRQYKTPRRSSPASFAEFMASSQGAQSVVDRYPNLEDQLIIEPVDAEDDSEIEDDGRMDPKSDGGDETDVVQDTNDDEGRPRGSKRSKRGRRKSKPASVTTALSANTSKNLQIENAGISGSDSEEGSRNNAPNLTPESMKAPPKLRRVAESRKSEPLAGEDAENPNDARPPVLLPSVNILDRKTASARGGGSLGPLRRCVSTSNLANLSAQEGASPTNAIEPEFEPSTRRSRRKSGMYAHDFLVDEDFDTPGPSTRRRGGYESDTQGLTTRRGRSRSRSRMEVVVTPPVVELPTKRERKKKTDPQFVQESLISKKRSRSSVGGTPPTPSTSSSTPSAPGSESKRGRPKGSGRGRRRKSVGRPRKSALATDPEDDFFAAEVLDLPLVREDRMRIEGNNAEDDNEDYCNVCQDGGDGDLLCCDVCPKVYHFKCHIPAIDQIPEGDWQCLFCKTREEILSIPESVDTSCPPGSLQHKNAREFMITCKFLSELFSVKESLYTRTYFETVYRLTNKCLPSSLNVVRTRLTLMTPSPYGSFNEVVDDLRLMFRQANEFYREASHEQVQTQVFETQFLAIHQDYASFFETASTDPQVADESDPLA